MTYSFTPTAEQEGAFGWWLFTATDEQRAAYPFWPHPAPDQVVALRAQWIAHHTTSPAALSPAPAAVGVTPLAWPSQTVAPAPMVVGGSYAFAFTPSSDPQGHSISIAEFQSPPRMRSWCLATDPAGANRVPNGDGVGISGIVILGSDAGQCVVQQGVTYYLVVTNSVGTPGDDATGVVTLR